MVVWGVDETTLGNSPQSAGQRGHLRSPLCSSSENLQSSFAIKCEQDREEIISRDKKNYKTCEFEFNCERDESREGNEWLKI